MARQSTSNGYHGGGVSADKNGCLFFMPVQGSSIFNVCIGDDVAQSIRTAVM